jgi:hypothetical protein
MFISISFEIWGFHGVLVKIKIFWRFKPCRLASIYGHFGGMWCLHLQIKTMLHSNITEDVNVYQQICQVWSFLSFFLFQFVAMYDSFILYFVTFLPTVVESLLQSTPCALLWNTCLVFFFTSKHRTNDLALSVAKLALNLKWHARSFSFLKFI